ncbi:MAG TPA: hypothetical protein VH044_06975 [Polyangiaceae bacterium]|jgi:hypothetical protein|nr:hypothetical protein [Polyangiaceae bacterium]
MRRTLAATAALTRARAFASVLAFASTLGLASALARDAAASPLMDLTGGTDGMGGLQARTVAGGASAAYFNPALLVDAPVGLTIGVLAVSEQIGIALDGRPSTASAVPDGIANASHAGGVALSGVPIATNLLQNGRAATKLNGALASRPRQADGSGHETTVYETLGFAARLFDDQLAIGFYGIVPDGDFTKLDAFYNDEREQYFSNSLHPELYSDRLVSVSLAFGAAWKFSSALSVGLGASLMLHAGVVAPTYVANAANLGNILIDTNASVNVSVSPHMGVAYAPTPRVHLTGTVAAPEKNEMDVDFTFLLPNGLQQGSTFPLLYDYMPWQVALGGTYDLVQNGDESFSVAATAVYEKWSDYLDRHAATPSGPYRWYDTISPTVGARYRQGPTGAFLDLQYKPSPVPAQTGRTNYVDNDRLGAGGGFDYAFTVKHTAMHVGAQAQAFWLVPRHQTKLPTPNEPDGLNHYPNLVTDEVPDDTELSGAPFAGSAGLQTNNPGWPGFGSAGVIFGGGLYVSVTP